jgi:expansin (peptidoglycan-binding protein)
VTYYNPGVGLGSCGFHSADSSFTVAVSATLLSKYDVDSNPNHNKLCGKRIRVFRGGKSVDVTIMDKCPGGECTEYSLDLSPAAFDQIGSRDDGRYHDMSWSFLDEV